MKLVVIVLEKEVHKLIEVEVVLDMKEVMVATGKEEVVTEEKEVVMLVL